MIISLLRRYGHYLVICALTMAFYFPLLLPGMGLPAAGDFFGFHAPFRVYTSLRLHSGEIPFRAPEMFGGYPIFQDPQFALLYPVNLLFGLLVPNPGNGSALDAYMLINLLILSLGAVFFIRSFSLRPVASVAGAAIACFNGFMVIHVAHVNMLQVLGMSLFSAGLLIRFARGGASDFRLPLAAGVALAMATLAGHPQTSMYTHYAIAVGMLLLSLRAWCLSGRYRIAARIIIGTGVAIMLGLMLAAIQLIPTAELLKISTRANISRAEALYSAVQLHQLPVLLLPGFYTTLPWHLDWPPYFLSIPGEAQRSWFQWLGSDFWEGYVPMGMVSLCLGLTGWFRYRKQWLVQVLGWGSLFLLGCSVGENLPFYGWLYDVVPGFSLVRVCTRILILFFPAWGLLAALGVESILQNDTAGQTARRWSVCILVAVLMGWTAWVFTGDEGGWLDKWLRAFSGSLQSDVDTAILKLREERLENALLKQLIIVLAMLAMLVPTLWLSVKSPTRRLTAVCFLLGVELTLYCFGWATTINYPSISSVRSPALASLPEKQPGRIVAPGFFQGGPALNSALVMDKQLVNGYTVTIDDWVTALQPETMLPWDQERQELLLDLWNVTDIVMPRRVRIASIGAAQVPVDDWGWTIMGSRWTSDSGVTSEPVRASMPVRLNLDLETSQPIKMLHVLSFVTQAGGMASGAEMARITATTTDSSEKATVSVILGQNVSDARYPIADPKARLAHERAPLAYFRLVPNHWSSEVSIYDAALNLATSAPLQSISIEATAPYPIAFGVSYVVAILQDGSAVVKRPELIKGWTETKSGNPDFSTISRTSSPGFVRLSPNAIGGSYKKTEYVMNRLFHTGIDPLQTLVVDKRRLEKSDLEELNAPDADSFTGTCTIRWDSPEKAIIHASANQRGWLYLSYAWDGGWSARRNEKPVEVYRANGPFMAIPVDAGDNTIVMRYRPAGLVAGSIISGVAVLLLVGGLILTGGGRRRFELPITND